MEQENLTRKQLREQKRQEKLVARAGTARSRTRQKMIVILIIILGVVGLGVLLTIAGNSGGDTTGNVDTIADPVKGNTDATVVVKEYSDFQCPACKAAKPAVDQILTQYGDRIRFEYNDFPLRSTHRNAEKAAIAANCADLQGTFWEYHDMLFEKQSDWEGLSGTGLVDVFVGYGEQLTPDVATFRTCIENNETQERVNEDIREATRRDVGSTPTFFVGEERVVGADPAGLTTAIEKALAQ